ncbi:MAG TPA: thiamine pyrophosphate-binding protein [Dehalococcoidia bacterium]|jgi:thiamine pyrophosphate-dependent acetolactate synthase large subunit-like protein|nr:thiamine pyrophosphate-binding protein [Dehalococcoidia bacterium]
MINNTEAVKLLNSKRENSVIVATMNAGNARFGLPTVSSNDSLDVPLSGAMGKAGNFALGVALANPDRKVMCLDGDGSLLMNLGTMVTVANKSVKNMYHFVFDNGAYCVTGGQPVPGAGIVDWKAMGDAAGYAATFSFENLEDLVTGIDEVFAAEGPVFVRLAVDKEIENTPVQFRERPRRTMKDAIIELPKALS